MSASSRHFVREGLSEIYEIALARHILARVDKLPVVTAGILPSSHERREMRDITVIR
jgi:hypothetical protein